MSYFQDGPLAVKYSEEQLSKFIWIDMETKYKKFDHFGIFYLNQDTLVVQSTGGVTFFFTKVPERPEKK